ncbi:hypothetical protein VTN02DRAFT_3573 [Thermoascus thermophilus]
MRRSSSRWDGAAAATSASGRTGAANATAQTPSPSLSLSSSGPIGLSSSSRRLRFWSVAPRPAPCGPSRRHLLRSTLLFCLSRIPYFPPSLSLPFRSQPVRSLAFTRPLESPWNRAGSPGLPSQRCPSALRVEKKRLVKDLPVPVITSPLSLVLPPRIVVPPCHRLASALPAAFSVVKEKKIHIFR